MTLCVKWQFMDRSVTPRNIIWTGVKRSFCPYNISEGGVTDQSILHSVSWTICILCFDFHSCAGCTGYNPLS